MNRPINEQLCSLIYMYYPSELRIIVVVLILPKHTGHKVPDGHETPD